MKPLIYTDRSFLLLFGCVLIVWAISEWMAAHRRPRESTSTEVKKQDRGSFWILALANLISLVFYFLCPVLLPQAAISGNQVALFWLGVLVFLLGVGWKWYAVATLGQFFTVKVRTHSDQHVIQQGPYQFMRHPAYSGMVVMMLGAALMVPNWVSLIALLILPFPGLLYRMHVEEQRLILGLGTAYSEYMRRVPKRLLPFIY